MSLRKGNNKPWEKEKKPNFFGEYNDSNPNNPSHKVNLPTNFELRSIFLEDIDQAVFQEFHNRFLIMEKPLALLSGDAEISSLQNMNSENFDNDKEFMQWPLFVYSRTDTKKMYRTNPSYKRVLYVVPKKKAQGIVFEEYIAQGPINWELTYEFQFLTHYREACNDLEEQLNYYFRNKRNIINFNNERFSVGPISSNDKVVEVNLASRENSDETSVYVGTFRLKVWCWTRDLSDMQKRERPNSYTLTMVIKDEDGKVTNQTKDEIYVEQYIIKQDFEPEEPIEPS